MISIDLDNVPSLTTPPTDYSNEFDRIKYLDCSYDYFYRNYLITNKPCVISGVSAGWRCQKEWIRHSKPDLGVLLNNYGKATVPVSDCSEKYFNSQRKDSMVFSDYLEYWKGLASSQHQDTSLLYLKDWHFFKDIKDSSIYSVPLYFASDWLNEFYLGFPELDDDYRFVYMGPKGTWTPLHKDVFTSFSWSVNICGVKEWQFYPPGEENFLKDNFGNLIYDVNKPEAGKMFPNREKAKCVRLIQKEGDAVFVPSGWYHQVVNKDDTISINHNWINACNIRVMYESILDELKLVEKELSDCADSPDWSEMCQRLLKANFGFDLNDFVKFVGYIAAQRVDCLKSETQLKCGCYNFGRNHLMFDLNTILPLLKSLYKLNICSQQISDYISSIEDVLL